jgi:hypothetical protein
MKFALVSEEQFSKTDQNYNKECVDILQQWDQHRTPYSPAVSNAIADLSHEHEHPVPIQPVNASILTNSECSVIVRSFRLLIWKPLELTQLYSLPYKFVFRITVPSSIERSTQLEFNLLQELENKDCSHKMSIQKRRVPRKEIDGPNYFDYTMYFLTNSHQESNSPFRFIIKNKNTQELLFSSNPKKILARRKRRVLKQRKIKRKFRRA